MTTRRASLRVPVELHDLPAPLQEGLDRHRAYPRAAAVAGLTAMVYTQPRRAVAIRKPLSAPVYGPVVVTG
jgi:hypothetical protein